MFIVEDTEGAEVMNKVKKTCEPCELCERKEGGCFLRSENTSYDAHDARRSVGDAGRNALRAGNNKF